MLDSVSAASIPLVFRGERVRLVAGYADGPHKWGEADWQRFPPDVKRVRIAIWNNKWDAHMLDIEPGNNDAKGALPWIKGKWERGEVPTIYCFTDLGPAGYRISDVRRECDAAGVRRPLIVVAKWDDDPSTFDPTGDPEIIGKQYAHPPQTGGHFDASIVADHWPGVDEEVGMTPEEVKALIRAMLTAPEGALLVREALTRPDTDNDGSALIEQQLKDTETATRRWIVGL